MRLVKRSAVIAIALALASRATVLRGQVQPALCLQSFSPGVLGIPNNLFEFGGQLFHIDLFVSPQPPVLNSATYLTQPRRPNNGTKIWELAAVDAGCNYHWVGFEWWYVVELTRKYGYLSDARDECEPGPQGLHAISSPDQPDDGNDDCGDGDGEAPESSACHDEWVIVEVSSDGGDTWEVYWAGWAEVCG